MKDGNPLEELVRKSVQRWERGEVTTGPGHLMAENPQALVDALVAAGVLEVATTGALPTTYRVVKPHVHDWNFLTATPEWDRLRRHPAAHVTTTWGCGCGARDSTLTELEPPA